MLNSYEMKNDPSYQFHYQVLIPQSLSYKAYHFVKAFWVKKHQVYKSILKSINKLFSRYHGVAYYSIIGLLAGILCFALLVPEGVWQLVTILGVCILFLLPCFYALKLEVSVGAYQCKHCGHEIVPTYTQALMAMHRGTTRYLHCPQCNQHSWCKKVLKK